MRHVVVPQGTLGLLRLLGPAAIHAGKILGTPRSTTGAKIAAENSIETVYLLFVRKKSGFHVPRGLFPATSNHRAILSVFCLFVRLFLFIFLVFVFLIFFLFSWFFWFLVFLMFSHFLFSMAVCSNSHPRILSPPNNGSRPPT